MTESIVNVSGLSHRYSRAWAIHDINFEIRQTGILGLLGSNGAGKSTTMNIMCGVLNHTLGQVTIDGIDLRKYPLKAKKQIGFLPQNPPLYFDLTVDEYLRHCAWLRQIPDKEIKQAVKDAKVRCGVDHFSKRLISNLSGGYRQRVGIAQAIIHRPKLVVLDEPTNGLDPNQILEVRKLIREIAEERSVIFSTHILSEVQALCKDIVMIEQGSVVFSDTMEAFDNYVAPNSMMISFEQPPSKRELLSIEGIKQVEFITSKKVRLQFSGDNTITEKIIDISVTEGWRLQEINLEKTSLDTVFAQLSNQNHNENHSQNS